MMDLVVSMKRRFYRVPKNEKLESQIKELKEFFGYKTDVKTIKKCIEFAFKKIIE